MKTMPPRSRSESPRPDDGSAFIPDICPSCGSREVLPEFEDGRGWECFDCKQLFTGTKGDRELLR